LIEKVKLANVNTIYTTHRIKIQTTQRGIYLIINQILSNVYDSSCMSLAADKYTLIFVNKLAIRIYVCTYSRKCQLYVSFHSE